MAVRLGCMRMWMGLMSCYGDGLHCLRWLLRSALGHSAFGHLAFGHLAFGQPSGIMPSGTGTSSLKPSLTKCDLLGNKWGLKGWTAIIRCT